MRHALMVALSFGILAGATTSVAYAQATRTWVSGVGDDANPCSRTAPCKTFAGAISKTAAKGEIDVIDVGGFGALTITKAITIDGGAGLAGVLVSGTNGIVVNAGNADVVILRNLDFDGIGTGLDGIKFMNGKQLIVENTKIFGFIQNGVEVTSMATTGAAGDLVISNSTISTTTASAAGYGNGIRTSWGLTMVSHSVITGNDNVGLLAENSGVINADSNVLTGNRWAVIAGNGGAGQAAATMRVSNNDVYGNKTGFGCGGGVLASNGTNRMGSNSGGPTPCSPTVTTTQQ